MAPNQHPTAESVREYIDQIEKLFDSKINTLRFEVVTGLANLKELKRHDLDNYYRASVRSARRSEPPPVRSRKEYRTAGSGEPRLCAARSVREG